MTEAPIALIIISNGFIGAAMGMIIFTAAIRGSRSTCSTLRGRWRRRLAQIRFITLPALRWPISFVTIYQTLSLLVSSNTSSFSPRAGRFTTRGLRPLRLPAPLRERPIRVWRGISAVLIVIGVPRALRMALSDMERLLQRPRIEVH